MDANPDCKMCLGTGRITQKQAGISDVETHGHVACFRCWFGMDETESEEVVHVVPKRQRPKPAELTEAIEGPLRHIPRGPAGS